MSSRAQQLVVAANAWRDQYNPLRGLNMTSAVTALESMNTGQFTDLMWLYKHIEETDPDGIALVERGLSALEELDYDVKMATEEKHPGLWDEKLAEDQRAFLASRYEQIENLNDVIAHLALGFFRKYAFAQVLTNTDGTPVRFECHDQWNFVRDGLKGPFYWNPEAKSTSHHSLGSPLDRKRDRLVIMDYDRHVDRYGLLKFIRGNLAEKDWDGFIEVYGYNQSIVIMPPDVPADKEAEYLATAANIANGGNGALPNGSAVEHGNDSRGVQPFRPRLEWLQQQHVLAGTGGMLTMLTQSGSGTLAGGAHTDTWRTLSRARGKRISELLQRDFDRYELEKEFPGKPVLAYFNLATNEEQDVGDVVKHAVHIREAFPDKTMDPDEFQEKTGYRLVDVVTITPPPAALPPTLPNQPVTAKNRQAERAWWRRLFARLSPAGKPSAEDVQARLIDAATDAAVMADREDMRPLAVQLYSLLNIDDPAALAAAVNRLREDLPALAPRLMENPALADAIENTIGAAMVNGMAETASAHQEVTV